MVELKVRELFFDRMAVIRAAAAAGVRNLARGGSFVMRRARTSMRYRKRGSSAPGTPPFAHKQTGYALRRLLFFSFDGSSKSVVVGPEQLPNSSVIGTTVPNLHEFGGRVVRRVKRRVRAAGGGRDASPAQAAAFRRLVKAGAVDVARGPTTTVTYTAAYPPRPFMGPSLNAEIAAGNIASVWKDSVRAA